jgi:uridine kinase
MKTTIIAVAGSSGSGKTTIAREIDKHYGAEQCLTISSDNYYKDLRHLSAEERNNVNFDHPNSIDFELLAQHISLLKKGESVDIPTYAFATHARQEQTLRVAPKAIIIIEGILILHPACLTPLYDTKLFVDTDADICLMRRLKRDMAERGRSMEDVFEQYIAHVKPMFDAFVAPCKASADMVINNTTSFDIAPLVTHLGNKTTSPQHSNLGLFANPSTTTSQDETYEAGYTYFT